MFIPLHFPLFYFLIPGEFTSISGLIFVSVFKVLFENNLKLTSSRTLIPCQHSPDALQAELEG